MCESSQSAGLTVGMSGNRCASRSRWPYNARVRWRASRSAAANSPASYNRPMGSLAKPVVCIVTPYSKKANNGNWRTAARWARMLGSRCKVIVQTEWNGKDADVMLALHARRSASSIARFNAAHPGRPVAVVLTGTDLYKDLPDNAEAVRSLEIAKRIVVLQEDAQRMLEPRFRERSTVIVQSATPLKRGRKASGRLDLVAVGHLRAEKDPRTLFAAM